MTVWALPFPTSTITSPFGYRTKPYPAYHSGVDFGSNNGKAIKAPASGKVVAKGYNGNKTSGWGHYLWVRADDDAFYGVAHMRAASTFDVGDRVSRADTLGYVGSTGAAATYGPHLHLSISTGTKAQAVALNRDYLVDPIAYIKARTTAAAGGGTTPFRNRKAEKMLHFYTKDGPAGSNGLRYHILHSGGVYTYTSGGSAFPNAVAAEIGNAIETDAAFIDAMKRQHAEQNPGGVTNVSGGAVDVAALIAALEKLGEGLEEKLDAVLAATKALNPPG